jgi:hypothetical protein
VRDRYVTAPETGERDEVTSGLGPVDFGVVWPSTRARVAAVLTARGLQAADVDDVTQEVAVRALRGSQHFGSQEHFVRWCCRVAMNLHVDAVRRQRRLSPHPPPDGPGLEDTAGAAVHRMALDALAAGVAELSPEERQLLLDPQPAGSRREAVGLAVRRHRLRARLATLVEGLAAGLAILRVRRAVRSPSTAAKVSLVGVPVVAGLLIVPLTAGTRSSPSKSSTPSASLVALPLGGPTRSVGAGSASSSPGAGASGRPPASTPSTRSAAPHPASRIVLDLNPAAPPVWVAQENRPAPPLVCLFGPVNTCVNRPVPPVPEPNLGPAS